MKIDEQWDCWTLCAIKIEGKNRGEEGATPVTTTCSEAGEYKCVNIYTYVYGMQKICNYDTTSSSINSESIVGYKYERT